MKKKLIETVLDIVSSEDSVYPMREEELFELQKDISRSGTMETQGTPRLSGAAIGLLVDLGTSGELLVDFPANTSGRPLPARSSVALGKNEIGRKMVLLFEDGDPRRPIIVGLIQHPQEVQSISLENTRNEKQTPIAVELDGERLVFTAHKEIVFRCGEANITLTHAGKVLIRGAYLLSRSSGVNRIKGGAVQIN